MVMSPVSIGRSAEIDYNPGSTIKASYGDFMEMMGQVSHSYLTNEAMTFKLFPNKSVTPDNPSFGLFTNYSINQFEQTVSTLMKGEEYKNSLDKMIYSLFGG